MKKFKLKRNIRFSIYCSAKNSIWKSIHDLFDYSIKSLVQSAMNHVICEEINIDFEKKFKKHEKT